MTQRPWGGEWGGGLVNDQPGRFPVGVAERIDRSKEPRETHAYACQQHFNKEADGSGRRAFRAADWHDCVFTPAPLLCLLENGRNKTLSTQFSFTPGERRRNGDYI